MLPDVALAAATVALFYSVCIFPGYQKFFSDSDAGWHIRSGQWIVAHGALPATDPFSFTMADSRWYAWEWGADIIVGTIEHKWGLSGVVFFYGMAIAGVVWLWFQLNWLAGGNFFLAALFAAPMISTTTLHWLARPHVLSWLFLIATVMLAESLRKRRPGVWELGAIAAVSCLWANVHGSFFFGPMILCVYGAGIVLGGLVWEGAEQSSRGHWIAAAAALLASFANPFGWNLHKHVFLYLTDSELLSRISEFQSFDFHTGGALQVMLVLALAAMGGVLALADRNLPVFLLTALLAFSGLRAARGLPLLALLCLPLANGVITRQLAGWQGLTGRLRRAVDGFLGYSKNLRAIDARSSGLVWAPVPMLLCLGFLHVPAVAAKTGFPAKDFPVAAANAVASLPQDARIVSTDKFGGYLIYRFAGERKVFFDGRSDLYGVDFLKRCGRLMQARPGWRVILDSYQVNYALLPSDYPLTEALREAGWRPVYHDDICSLLARN